MWDDKLVGKTELWSYDAGTNIGTRWHVKASLQDSNRHEQYLSILEIDAMGPQKLVYATAPRLCSASKATVHGVPVAADIRYESK